MLCHLDGSLRNDNGGPRVYGCRCRLAAVGLSGIPLFAGVVIVLAQGWVGGAVMMPHRREPVLRPRGGATAVAVVESPLCWLVTEG